MRRNMAEKTQTAKTLKMLLVSPRLQLINLLFIMTFRRKLLTSAYLLILMFKVFSGQTTTCHQAEYHIGNECCPMCLPGSRVKTDCTEFRSTSCLPCLEGTYMNKPTGLKQCFPCSRCDAGSGLKIKSPCSTTSDTVCEPQEGFYCMERSKDGCGAAQKHKSCEPGQYISQKGWFSCADSFLFEMKTTFECT
uniref:TNFR-Cys domain-containing protein n=1 Tax=Anabas testudineus TaxID=64144 RepID=A0A3Q1JPW3_ANATE